MEYFSGLTDITSIERRQESFDGGAIGLGYEFEGRHMDRDATRSYRPCR
jgi:hypothetical protein